MKFIGAKNFPRSKLILILLFGIIIFLLSYKLEDVPKFWFDEGWVSSVARNWYEFGHYGQLQNGQPVPADMLNVGFPMVMPIALSYRLFGVGIWQSRLPILPYAIGTFYLIYFIASRIYAQRIAVATILVAIFPFNPWVSPIEYSRYVVGEIPAAFFYLAGLAAILMFLRRPWMGIPLLITSWALAMLTKSQFIPIMLVSYILTSLVFAWKRSFKIVVFLSIGFLGSLLLTFAVMKVFPLLGNGLPPEIRAELLSATAFTLAQRARIVSIKVILISFLTVYGFAYMAYDYLKGNWAGYASDGKELTLVLLLTLVGSWLTWYTLFSIGWMRYMVTACLLGSMFVAYALHQLTNGFDILHSLRQSTQLLHLKFSRENIRGFIVIFIILYSLAGNSARIARIFTDHNNDVIKQVVHFVNSATKDDALVETYEMELFPFLNRSYHYPPNDVVIDGLKRYYIDPDIMIDYDIPRLETDYIILGDNSGYYGFYDNILVSGDYAIIREIGLYKIYQSVK